MNRALFSVHCYLSWGFVAPYVMAFFHVIAALRFYMKEKVAEESPLNPKGNLTFPFTIFKKHYFYFLFLIFKFFLLGLILVGCLVTCTAIELLSMWNLTRIEVRLCNMLSPEAPPLSLSAYNWCLVSFSFIKLYTIFINF